ncbi:MAG: hypothetical protein OEZ30_03670 [Candidatus Aminicenantes bacterium]|nr:hypothetical protein [Candidatus Aminicenantes bacterium]
MANPRGQMAFGCKGKLNVLDIFLHHRLIGDEINNMGLENVV